jgi:hypothetical protein
MAVHTEKILEKAIGSGSTQPATLLLANQTLNLNTTNDQPMYLKGGNTFVITDILITNVSAVPLHADDGEWWSGTGRNGMQYGFTIESDVPQFQLFTSSSVYGNSIPNLSNMSAFIYLGSQSNYIVASTANSPVYFSLGTPEGSPLTCDMYIYGTILN